MGSNPNYQLPFSATLLPTPRTAAETIKLQAIAAPRLLAAQFVIQCFRGYIGTVGPSDSPALYRCLLKESQISQGFKNGAFPDIVRQTYVARRFCRH